MSMKTYELNVTNDVAQKLGVSQVAVENAQELQTTVQQLQKLAGVNTRLVVDEQTQTINGLNYVKN